MFKVNYIHHSTSGDYRVSRTFENREAAQRFIDDNALVHPLPGVHLYEIKYSERVNSYIVTRDGVTILVTDSQSDAYKAL